jgi:hypothetical protein
MLHRLAKDQGLADCNGNPFFIGFCGQVKKDCSEKPQLQYKENTEAQRPKLFPTSF